MFLTHASKCILRLLSKEGMVTLILQKLHSLHFNHRLFPTRSAAAKNSRPLLKRMGNLTHGVSHSL